MAKYTAEITDKTKVETLNFMGIDFKQTWVPAPYGTSSRNVSCDSYLYFRFNR